VTGDGGQQPPPGWYADPDGTPGMVRWWSGSGWSDVAVPTGPGVAVQSSPVLAPARPDVREPDPVAEPPPRSRRGTWLVLGAAAMVVAVVVGLVIGNRDHDEPAAAPADRPGTSQLPSGPTFTPSTVRIIDQESGISYPYLGEGWREYDFAYMYETTTVAGQYFTTQELTPAGDRFIAQCTSGPVAEGLGWTGPGSEAATAAAVADSVRGNYYPGPNERRILRDEPRTVDGHAAHLLEFQLSWDVEGYDATGERAAVLVVDVGRPAPALLYLSIPNTHAELYGVIDAVVGAVDVL
jgi:hypothetical protein